MSASRPVAPSCRSAGCSAATSTSPVASRQPARTCRSCCPTCSTAPSTRAGCSTSNCRWNRRRRRTRRWTSGGRSRSCCDRRGTNVGGMLTPDYRDYVVAHGSQLDEVARDLVAETRATYPREAGMLIEPEQAAFMTLLTKIVGVRRAVEIGTFTGFSALAIARGLAEGGRLVCFDVSDEYTKLARRAWARAG